MSSRRALVRLPAALAALALLKACGESGGPTTVPALPPGQPSAVPQVSVTVSPPRPTLTAIGDTVRLTALGHDQNGLAIALTSIYWATSDWDVATVDDWGLVRAGRFNGTATITARGQWRFGTFWSTSYGGALVTVRRDVAAVEVTPSAEIVFVGHTLRLSAEPLDADGHAVAVDGFSWRSSETAVATVASLGSSGLVQGVAPGRATITVTADRVEATVEITVVPDPDRAALSALYAQTGGTGWSNDERWLTDAPLGDWHGVVTDDSQRVVTLILDANGLSGGLPPELGDMTRLQTLDLGSNDLSGPIPSELGTLTHLTSLDLHDNRLSGPVPPELGNLAELAALRLGNNRLAGGFPSELGDLARLQTLSLASNELEDTIPPGLGELGELVTLRLTDNRLTGGIPPELGNLSRLETLDLAGNDLHGPIPPELGNLIGLTSLALGVNRLSGPIPPELGNLTSLLSLSLWGTGLSGPLPPEIGNLARLRYLNLSRNRLTGRTPRRLLQLTSLSRFFFERNDGLCAPGDTEFSTWLRSIGNVRGPVCDAPPSTPDRPGP